MSKITIYQESFLVSGIMCFDGCGNIIQGFLQSCINDCVAKKILPHDAKLKIDAEPYGLGLHKIIISIESAEDDFVKMENFHSVISEKIKKDINFDIIDSLEEPHNKKSNWKNWKNILINLISMGVIISFTLLFPPSIFLTFGLTALSFLTSAFTSREYLRNFFYNLKKKNFANMSTTISLGWFLSLAHTLFHTITMPIATGFSMIFMGFIMPLMLITCINGMDEIKRLVREKSKKIQLKGMKTLFPQMSATYRCLQLSEEDFSTLSNKINMFAKIANENSTTSPISNDEHESLFLIETILNTNALRDESKNLLNVGMLIEIKPGECFPVDCVLVKGNTIIDASLLTGETQQSKQIWQNIPAGAINLGQTVTVYATKNPYNSTVNSLLFRSNRARNTPASKDIIPKFAYLYTALIIIGIIGAIFVPVAFGVISASLIMQNVIGILFSMCPCTIAIGYELPKLISLHHRSNKGINLRDDSLIDADGNEMHTIVFDKTGTLTTGNSVVESSDIALNSPLWQRIYLLEKAHGKEHPLALAIQKYYEENSKKPLFNEVKDYKVDAYNRGLSATVQGKVLQLGSYDYLQSNNISLPKPDTLKMSQGFSAVFVAEDGLYQGVIYIKHEIRKGVLESLTRLKREGKKIIMLTGDNAFSARGFNQQLNSIFAEEDIHAGQSPQDKELFLQTIMSTSGINPTGVWFCGDGLNDAPSCRIVSEQGGVSCAMNSHDKSAFFTDISLNGSLDYLFFHKRLNNALRENIYQNKGILIYSTIAFLAFIISFSIVGIAVPPLIPMAIMLSTTLYILFNSYRTQLDIDNTLDKVTPWGKKLLSSDLSIGLLLGASSLLICAVLVATITTGGLALPVIAFTAGAIATFSSICSLSAFSLFGGFAFLLTSSLLAKSEYQKEELTPHIQHNTINSASGNSLEELTINQDKNYGNLFTNSPDDNISDNNVFDACQETGFGFNI